MEQAQHPPPKTAEIETVDGESSEFSASRGNFRRKRTVDELAVEQGIAVPQPLDEMIGAVADLWADDEDFDRFVQGLYDRRLDQRGGGKGEP